MSTVQTSSSQRDVIISRLAVGFAIMFLVLGIVCYQFSPFTIFFAAFSSVGQLFLAFLQVFPNFTLRLPHLQFRLTMKWILLSICITSLALNLFLVFLLPHFVSLSNQSGGNGIQNRTTPSVTSPNINIVVSRQQNGGSSTQNRVTPPTATQTPSSICQNTNKSGNNISANGNNNQGTIITSSTTNTNSICANGNNNKGVINQP